MSYTLHYVNDMVYKKNEKKNRYRKQKPQSVLYARNI